MDTHQFKVSWLSFCLELLLLRRLSQFLERLIPFAAKLVGHHGSVDVLAGMRLRSIQTNTAVFIIIIIHEHFDWHQGPYILLMQTSTACTAPESTHVNSCIAELSLTQQHLDSLKCQTCALWNHGSMPALCRASCVEVLQVRLT